MKCPTCTTTDLLMTERLGVEIDYCPQCRGVWLDRGELDKIIERSSRDPMQAPAVPPPVPLQVAHPQYVQQQPRYDSHHGYKDDHHSGHQGYQGYQKKSIWKELFD